MKRGLFGAASCGAASSGAARPTGWLKNESSSGQHRLERPGRPAGRRTRVLLGRRHGLSLGSRPALDESSSGMALSEQGRHTPTLSSGGSEQATSHHQPQVWGARRPGGAPPGSGHRVSRPLREVAEAGAPDGRRRALPDRKEWYCAQRQVTPDVARSAMSRAARAEAEGRRWPLAVGGGRRPELTADG